MLERFAAEARSYSISVSRIDARDFAPTLSNVLEAIEAAQVTEPGDDSYWLRHLVLLDTYEHLRGIEPSVRRELLRRISSKTLLVIAGREPPSVEWRALSLWGKAFASIELNNLSPADARKYLTGSGIEGKVASEITEFTHGHPLGLVLAAEAWRDTPDVPFMLDTDKATNLITDLCRHLVRQISDPTRRAALETSAILHTTTETALDALLDGDSRGAFQWLCKLHFMKIGQRGIFPHDLTREVILAELRWRNPARFALLVERALRYFCHLIESSVERSRFEAAFHFTFTAGHTPQLAWLMKTLPDNGLVLDQFQPTDEPILSDSVLRHEGPTSVQYLQYWLARRPEWFRVVRGTTGIPLGFLASLRLDRTTPEERAGDPEVCAAWDYARQKLRRDPQGRIHYWRFSMECDAYQKQLSPASAVYAQVSTEHLVEGFTMGFARMRADMEQYWRRFYTLGDGQLVPELQHKSDGHTFLVRFHHYPGQSSAKTFVKVYQRLASEYLDSPILLQSDVSSIEDHELKKFCGQVREALSKLRDPQALAKNPLVYSKAVQSRMLMNPSLKDRAHALEALLVEEVESLRNMKGGDIWYSVLDAAYLHPAVKEEAAAAQLSMSYAKFRRKKGEAIAHIAAALRDRGLS